MFNPVVFPFIEGFSGVTKKKDVLKMVKEKTRYTFISFSDNTEKLRTEEQIKTILGDYYENEPGKVEYALQALKEDHVFPLLISGEIRYSG